MSDIFHIRGNLRVHRMDFGAPWREIASVANYVTARFGAKGSESSAAKVAE
jgi:hypothetical protein